MLSMLPNLLISQSQNDEPDAGRPSPYDAMQGSAADLWFVADPADAAGDLPLPRANRRALVDPQIWARDWARAEAAQARDLAGVALLFGRLAERLRLGPPGWRQRLALTEAAGVSWWAGDRITAERLALWSALRLSGPLTEMQGLGRAEWALRRLSVSDVDLGSVNGISGFFGRKNGPEGAASGVPELLELARALAHLHPLTQALAMFEGWLRLGDGGPGRDIEAAVLAARVAAGMSGDRALFVPLGLSGHATGPVADRLTLWLRETAQAIRAALTHLDRIAVWQDRAGAAVVKLQGRTPALLVMALAAWPLVTAPLAEDLTGASRAAVQRNLALMQGLGLIREVTGQGRYRVWAAKL